MTTKMTANMMETLKAASLANEWHKGDMHRLYIDLAKAAEYYFDHDLGGSLAINRHERGSAKVWIDLETGDINTKNVHLADEVISQLMQIVSSLAPSTEETTTEVATSEEITDEINLTAQEIYDLCVTSCVTLRKDGNLSVFCDTPSELIGALKTHKSQIVHALSGYCFSRDVYTRSGLRNWKIVKASNIAYVSYPSVTVFSGTAQEVDAWAYSHRDDPLFSDGHTSKYYYVVDKSE